MLDSQSLVQQLLDAVGDAVILLDEQQQIVLLNGRAQAVFGYDAQEVVGRPVMALMPEGLGHDPPLRLADGESDERVELPGRRKNGDAFPAEATVSGLELDGRQLVMVSVRDITGHKSSEDQLERALRAALNARAELDELAGRLDRSHQRELHAARYDPLTDLPNRKLFIEELRGSIAAASRKREMVAVLFLDLDRFKVINDSLGHGHGDLLLRSVARRLATCLRDGDFAARLGGDEFTVMLRDVRGVHGAATVAERILRELAHPHHLGRSEVFATPSIGISLYPTDSADANALIKNADMAMYRAKDAGGGTYRFFTDSMSATALRRMELEINLRRAVKEQDFILHYQPLIDLDSGQAPRAEALVRWLHPAEGLIPPREFIPIAEETGLITAIGEQVLRGVCAQQRSWLEAGVRPARVAVNLSARQLMVPALSDTIAEVLSRVEVSPEQIGVEVTEAATMQDVERVSKTLRGLRGMGIEVAIDDFGTGYSSLSYLRTLPADLLKIDISFIRGIAHSDGDTAIVRAMIEMAHALGLTVVAEGVETEEQLAVLRSLRCDHAQGYLFSKPLPPDEFADWLSRGTSRASREAAA